MDVLMLVLFTCLLFERVLCGSYCYDSGHTFYCDYGCCGDDYNEHCCGVYAWIVVVAVIAGIILISFIVCVVCVFKKKQMAKGRVMASANQPTVQSTTVAYVNQPTGGFLNYPPPYQAQPPVYPQHQMYPPPPPPNYGADPVYPPSNAPAQ